MAEVKTITAQPFSGEKTIKMVKNLLRYDIPFLLLGKSSIGKSYSITELANEFRVPHSFLFIGSEKPSNIEGLPRLVGQKAESGDILEFFKPNWFPNAQLIQKYVSNGKKLFDSKIIGAYTGKKEALKSGKDFYALNNLLEVLSKLKWESSVTTSQNFELINTALSTSTSLGKKLTSKPVKFERDIESEKQLTDPNTLIKDEIRDLNLYLSTILGYGNFWLILDELDKVDEREKDKYAPLLHIVRERHIKDYSFQTLNDGKGAMVPSKVNSGSDYRVIKTMIDESIKDGLPLLDGRVIGIANATSEIEDALFRRFLHIVVEDVMMINKPEPRLADMRRCFDAVNTKSDEKFGGTGLLGGLEMKYIPEINLQWQYGFFPKLLNTADGQGNFFYLNLMENFAKLSKEASKNPSKYQNQILNATKTTALYKIVRNNFAVVNSSGQEMSPSDSKALREAIMDCINLQVGVNTSVEQDIAPEIATAGVVEESTTDLLREDIMKTINDYLTMQAGDNYEVAKMCGALMETEFPPQDLPTPISVSNWVDRVLSFLRVTMYNESGVFEQTELNKYLTPVLLKTLYKKVLSAKMDENAKKFAIQKVSLLFGKVFITDEVKTEALTFHPETVSEQADKMLTEVLPKLEESYMASDIWFLIDQLSKTQQSMTRFQEQYGTLYTSLKKNWGEQISDLADKHITALDLAIKKTPQTKPKRIKNLTIKLDRAIKIQSIFKQ